MKKAFFNKCCALALWGVALAFAFSGPSYASMAMPGEGIDDILQNITESSQFVPYLLAGLAYALGLLLIVLAIFKVKEHVLNPQQTPLRTPLIRFFIAGAFFALPMITQAAKNTLDGGITGVFDPSTSMLGLVSGFLGSTGVLGININGILESIIQSLQNVPAFIAAGTYLLALILVYSGLLKLKEHVENPEQTSMREGVIRLLVAGSFFALPTVFDALYQSIGGAGTVGTITSLFGMAGFFLSTFGAGGTWTGGFCNPVGSGVGNLICQSIMLHSAGIPAFLVAISYLIGMFLAVWGIYKIKAHVLNPSQTGLNEGVTRLLAAGLFFSLPAVAEIIRATAGGANTFLFATYAAQAFKRYHEFDPGGCTGLDGVLYCTMRNMLTPMHVLLNFISYVIGLALIMIGISRLTKNAQEGPKGPGGLGTVMTFAAGGAILSYNSWIHAFNWTFFGAANLGLSQTYAKLQYTTGMSQDELEGAHTTISAILKFMIIVGLISFVRGIYIIRNAAEGNQQSSVMSGVTHMVGGALAVNLGGLINAVQSTLGLTSYGIVFS